MKHQEALKAVQRYEVIREIHFILPSEIKEKHKEESLKLYDYINECVAMEKELEETKQFAKDKIAEKDEMFTQYKACNKKYLDTLHELELYKAFVNEFNFELINYHEPTEDENWDEIYLHQAGASDKAIDLFKKIHALGGKEE